jgi:hypothetical protein
MFVALIIYSKRPTDELGPHPIQQGTLSYKDIAHQPLTPGGKFYKQTDDMRVDLYYRSPKGNNQLLLRGDGNLEIQISKEPNDNGDGYKEVRRDMTILFNSPDNKYCLFLQPEIGYNNLYIANSENNQLYSIAYEDIHGFFLSLDDPKQNNSINSSGFGKIGWINNYFIYYGENNGGYAGVTLNSLNVDSKQLYILDGIKDDYASYVGFGTHLRLDAKISENKIIYTKSLELSYNPHNGQGAPTQSITVSLNPDGTDRRITAKSK